MSPIQRNRSERLAGILFLYTMEDTSRACLRAAVRRINGMGQFVILDQLPDYPLFAFGDQ